MLGKTHSAVGAASALLIVGGTAVNHPVDLAIGAAIAGIGGLLPDIDLGSEHSQKIAIFTAITFIVLGLKNFSPATIIGCFPLAFLEGAGLKSNHRGFTHSILALGLFSLVAYFMIPKYAIWFAVGYASHLVIDLLNKKGESLFFPIDAKVCFNLCASDGFTNKALASLATLAVAILFAGRML